jgi:hypothetical protein
MTMELIKLLHVPEAATNAKLTAFRYSCRIKIQGTEVLMEVDGNEGTWPGEACHPAKLLPGRLRAGAGRQRPSAPIAAALPWNNTRAKETHLLASML